ncbi:hypothetical protein LPJ56_000706 [Coemansia sp. RSA 2599]|nr:hypothetical protein LPJ75_000374 [Coemansia sp. RSA 2598]KAJ1829015.1 hypothetical protein LPJ56_000706 [Coemansia sp. RSA 2599]
MGPGDSAKTGDSRVGTVAQHKYHLVVCNSSSKEWPSKVETMSEPITALARGSIRLPGRAMVTLSDFAPLKTPSTTCCCASSANNDSSNKEHPREPANKYERIDVAVFPLGIVAKQIDVDGANRLLQWLSHDMLPTSWSATNTRLPQPPFDHAWLELTHNRHIFVCTHGSRDYLCGAHGGKLLEELRSLIDKRGLTRHVAAWSTSHIGGHKYAANAIVYPRGDWYGTWCDRCRGSSGPSLNPEADANAIIDSAINDLVWWDAWRGAINMSKNDQINAFKKSSSGHEEVTGHPEDTFTTWVPGILKRRSAGGN